jgi:hypothetical protein
MTLPKIQSVRPLANPTDDEAVRRWTELRQALGERRWPCPTPRSMSDRDRLNEAAQRALSLYPGPVGQLVHREIQAYLDFGHQFGQPSLITRLAEDLLATTTHQR